MLVETHGWLEEDEGERDDKSDDLMGAVELVDTLTEQDSEGKTDDEQNDADDLERCVDVADFLGGGEI